MVIDSSALLAILEGEPERGAFIAAIESAENRLVSAATFLETSIVVEARRGAGGLHHLDQFIELAGIELVPFDRDQALQARRAFSRYGKGRHPAGLNFGDCLTYGLAKVRDETVLFKGDDFSRTDIAAKRLHRRVGASGSA